MADHVAESDRRVLIGHRAVTRKAHSCYGAAIDHTAYSSFLRGLDDRACSLDVGGIHLARIARPEPIIGGNVEDSFASGHSLFQRLDVGKVARNTLPRNASDVLRAAGLTDQEAQVGALLGKDASDVASDK